MFGELLSLGGNLLGGLLGRSSASKAADKQAEMQEAFAKNSIRWRVADAKRAGIHPLAALGAQTHSYAPVAFDDPLPNALANAGQDLGRAIDAGRTGRERVDAYTKTVQDLTLNRMGLENQLLASQIQKVRQAGHPPPLPSGGSPGVFASGDIFTGGNSVLADGGIAQPADLVQDNPMQRVQRAPGALSQEPGSIAGRTFYDTPSGGLSPSFSSDLANRMDENPLGAWAWGWRELVAPNFSSKNWNPPYKAPWHSHWEWDSIDSSYKLKRHAQ